MDFDQLRRDLQWLRGEDGVVPAEEAVKVLSRLLAPLLATEGLELFEPESPGLGVDLFAASRDDDSEGVRHRASVAIEYKHHGQGKPINVDAIDQLIANRGKTPYDRAMLIGRFGFTEAAVEAARTREPVNIELFDLAGIDAWIRRLEVGKPGYAEQASVGRVSAPTHSPKSAPLSRFDVASPICWQAPLFDIPKLEYGQWLTCATVPMLHRVPMDVIDMPVEVGPITDEMFPESMLPQGALVPFSAARPAGQDRVLQWSWLYGRRPSDGF